MEQFTGSFKAGIVITWSFKSIIRFHNFPEVKQDRAVHSGGTEGAATPARKTHFTNIVFEFADLFLVAILVENHKKIY